MPGFLDWRIERQNVLEELAARERAASFEERDLKWLLPSSKTYAVTYNESRHREWKQISFTG
jgi:hypothetical protein